MHPHTIILNFSPTETSNLYETDVTESQIRARSMVKAFTVAAASARTQYGVTITHKCLVSLNLYFNFIFFPSAKC